MYIQSFFFRLVKNKSFIKFLFISHYMENTNSSEQILLEKRKRHQTYAAMDYLLSLGTYFDFFSPNAFQLVENANYFARKLNTPINSELLFLSYFYCDSSVFQFLESSGFEKKLKRNLAQNFPKFCASEPSFRNSKIKKIGLFLKKILNLNPEIESLKQTNFSEEILVLFEKASENALTRFKTPVISSEILFITLMEEKSTKVSKVIKKCFPNQMEWYLFRYDLMKNIHKHESSIRSDVVKNQQYFAYLLRTKLPTAQFDCLIKEKKLGKAVSIFRDSLILSTLKVDIFDSLLEDIHTSIRITSKRRYSP